MHRPAILLLLGLALLPASPGAQVLRQNETLTLFFTGDVAGEIVSCGCKVEDFGGASRRAAMLDTLRAEGWEFLLVDAGGLAPFGEWNAQKELKVEALAKATAWMRYDAVALGHQDLQRGPELVGRIVDWLGKPVVATQYDLGGNRSERSRIVDVQGKKVGIVAFLDETLAASFAPWLGVETWDAQRERVGALAGETDLLVALLQAPDTTGARRLVETFPEIDVVIGAHEGTFPGSLVFLEGTAVVGSGSQGKHLGRMEVSFAEDGGVSRIDAVYQPIVKEWGFRPAVDAIIGDYNRKIRELTFSGELDGSP